MVGQLLGLSVIPLDGRYVGVTVSEIDGALVGTDSGRPVSWLDGKPVGPDERGGWVGRFVG